MTGFNEVRGRKVENKCDERQRGIKTRYGKNVLVKHQRR